MQRSAGFIDLGRVALFILFGSFAGIGLFHLYQDEQFDGNVGHTTATIEGLAKSTSRKSAGSNYYATFSYKVGNDEFHSSRSPVAAQTYAVLKVGENVPIKFLFQHPAWSRIDWPDEDKWHWHDDVTLTGLFAGCLAVFIIITWRRRIQ